MRGRECPIGESAARSVIGEGPRKAPPMLVGEQPGGQEDLQGHAFAGPPGRLLAKALEQAGIPRDQVFVSNAVKHFKYELRGKRRIHWRSAACPQGVRPPCRLTARAFESSRRCRRLSSS